MVALIVFGESSVSHAASAGVTVGAVSLFGLETVEGTKHPLDGD
jgi:hypothetical protein